MNVNIVIIYCTFLDFVFLLEGYKVAFFVVVCC